MVASGLGGISEQEPIIVRPYAVGLFDVLGFKRKFESLGLEQIIAKYAALIDIVVEGDRRRAELDSLFPNRKEGPYWCSGGEIVIDSRVYMAYASDTLLVWSNYIWADRLVQAEGRLEELAQDPRHDWLFCPVPCDPFLDVCNELICRSLQIGLPLRGAVAVGDAVLDKARNIFLGQPIIEANLLEHGQRFIGAGMCQSFTQQTIPSRYSLEFSEQLKEPFTGEASGLVLDWPRHWRNTRKFDVRPVIESLSDDGDSAGYYQNTLASVELSKQFANDFEPGEACPIRSNYEQFSYARQGEIAAYARPVRRATAEDVQALSGQLPHGSPVRSRDR
ncbi:hypothetical protein [Dyella kyungheensis]|uniref:Uncharacterized protein n=1 Tax=Dyella kyungheensis TaxID=1242174 RepID=A0ABS2JLV0_9GAMM|nr:hypothetical protein [Dyella kyungheensis]MBM7119750.1 hypothetical protein [Dyella kyungheensis]